MKGNYMGKPKMDRAICPACFGTVEDLRSKYCSNKCQFEAQGARYIERWKAGLETGNIGNGRGLSVSRHVRKYLIRKFGERCVRCGWSERHPVTGKVPVTIEHIDGNPYNSFESNLTILCPNCHSLTLTYGALNKGRGRGR